MPKHANTFLVGADPELIFLNPPNLVQVPQRNLETGGLFGLDHNGWVIEPHPTPSRSVREVCANIRTSLDYLAYKYPDYRMRAGAHLVTPQRRVTLGGHVHLDLPRLNDAQLDAMDHITRSLEHFDILPQAECNARRDNTDYGDFGDIRAEHGHVEYRTMASWLYDPKVAMLCMTCIKLAAVDPTNVRGFRSMNTFKNWLEGFKEADDDVKWMFNRGYFDRELGGLDVDANVRTVWRANEERGKTIADSIVACKTAGALVGAHVRAARQLVLQNTDLHLPERGWAWNWQAAGA